jgi:hypothetical protein
VADSNRVEAKDEDRSFKGDRKEKTRKTVRSLFEVLSAKSKPRT